jgi:hypothetical protein
VARAMNRLQLIKDRLSAATPGPWHHVAGVLKQYVHSESGELSFSLPELHPDDGREWPCAATAELIANAPDDLEWAVGEIERLRSLVQSVFEQAEVG